MSCGVFLADVDDFAAMNEVYAEFFGDRQAGAHHDHRGVASPEGRKVEIDAVAYKLA